MSDIRREIVSGIGRLRNKKTISVLLDLLKDDDPNIVLQAIRGLLVFKDDKEIVDKLKKLQKHQKMFPKIPQKSKI